MREKFKISNPVFTFDNEQNGLKILITISEFDKNRFSFFSKIKKIGEKSEPSEIQQKLAVLCKRWTGNHLRATGNKFFYEPLPEDIFEQLKTLINKL